jgi:diphthine synthase
MTLYLIGVGLSDEKDITVKGLEAVKRCDVVYLEHYTSLLQCSKEDLETFYGKSITLANREQIENKSQNILDQAKEQNVAILIVGDPLSATTHINYILEAKKQNIPINIINNASVLTAVGITGLQLYKFGRITSVPFAESETPYTVIKENKQAKMHTLALLDLHPEKGEFLTIKDACVKILAIETIKKEGIFTADTEIIACARLGSDNPTIKTGNVKDIMKQSFDHAPYCIVIPGELHFMEEEVMKIWA